MANSGWSDAQLPLPPERVIRLSSKRPNSPVQQRRHDGAEGFSLVRESLINTRTSPKSWLRRLALGVLVGSTVGALLDLSVQVPGTRVWSRQRLGMGGHHAAGASLVAAGHVRVQNNGGEAALEEKKTVGLLGSLTRGGGKVDPLEGAVVAEEEATASASIWGITGEHEQDLTRHTRSGVAHPSSPTAAGTTGALAAAKATRVRAPEALVTIGSEEAAGAGARVADEGAATDLTNAVEYGRGLPLTKDARQAAAPFSELPRRKRKERVERKSGREEDPAAAEAPGRPLKIAFMFLTRGPLPLDHIWARFFEGQDPATYSVHIHAPPGFLYNASTTAAPHIFSGREVRNPVAADTIQWGGASLVGRLHPYPHPHTLHPAPWTSHPALYTSHPAPHTLHPTPCTLHL
jgi:hypothetical protein